MIKHVKNPMAYALSNPKYRLRVVKPKKGKGSFKRDKSGVKNSDSRSYYFVDLF
jgi:stalled ribosome alternative rescue factor ArfA